MNNNDKARKLCDLLVSADKGEFIQEDVENALLSMAYWKDEQFAKEKQALIDNACEWLKTNMYEGTCEQILSKKPYPFMKDFIDAFKKAMEE